MNAYSYIPSLFNWFWIDGYLVIFLFFSEPSFKAVRRWLGGRMCRRAARVVGGVGKAPPKHSCIHIPDPAEEVPSQPAVLQTSVRYWVDLPLPPLPGRSLNHQGLSICFGSIILGLGGVGEWYSHSLLSAWIRLIGHLCFSLKKVQIPGKQPDHSPSLGPRAKTWGGGTQWLDWSF